MKIELYVDGAANEWRVRIVTNDGDILFTSEGFQDHSDCYALVRKLKKQIGNAPVSEIGTL